MAAMRNRYQHFAYPKDGEGAAQGAYVAFVQHIVSFMQQHTTHILRVDGFFTDSAIFPLPASDPTYMIGKLKSYIPKLSEVPARKQLAGFIKTVSERAAVDGQQEYLVDQLVAAMSDNLEHGDPSAPSLRHVLMTAILPVYIENALSAACSWVVAKAILEACGACSRDLLYHTRFEDERSCHAVAEIITALLRSMLNPILQASSYTGLMAPHVLATLASTFRVAEQTLTVSQHVIRRLRRFSYGLDVRSSDGPENLLLKFEHYASSIQVRVSETRHFDPIEDANVSVLECQWPDTLNYTRKILEGSFQSPFVRRGNGWAEIVAPGLNDEEEKANLLAAIRAFRESYQTIFLV